LELLKILSTTELRSLIIRIWSFVKTHRQAKLIHFFSGKEEMLLNDIGFYNKLTVRKYQGAYYIFVNDILIKQLNNLNLPGDQVGFSVGLNSEISVDLS